ncbi:hypothetical protein DID74_00450 [Candidatus Marinamargulisbacteria bacterium SCGC AG-333-B06]|nr:hypothetical protein DID74_00450 [Candidatus Marinamargulisbacteria bacterium SCGC AG-333-B06]
MHKLIQSCAHILYSAQTHTESKRADTYEKLTNAGTCFNNQDYRQSLSILASMTPPEITRITPYNLDSIATSDLDDHLDSLFLITNILHKICDNTPNQTESCQPTLKELAANHISLLDITNTNGIFDSTVLSPIMFHHIFMILDKFLENIDNLYTLLSSTSDLERFTDSNSLFTWSKDEDACHETLRKVTHERSLDRCTHFENHIKDNLGNLINFFEKTEISFEKHVDQLDDIANKFNSLPKGISNGFPYWTLRLADEDPILDPRFFS